MKLNYKHITILLSVILHFIFVSSKVDTIWVASKPAKTKKRIKIVLREAQKVELKKRKKKQIVENEYLSKREKPKDSKYLSKLNQKYDRETVSKNIGSFKKAGKGFLDGSIKNNSSGKTKKAASDKKKVANKSKSNLFKKISLKDLSMKSKAFKDFSKNSAGLRKKGLKHAKSNIKGLSKSSDFVEDLPLGDMTRLNTIEYKYYGFYHRIRQKLEQYWGNSLREKANNLHRSGRRIASNSHKITSLTITLDTQGNIVDVHLKSTSGIRELDDAAIESFNKAGPFPNPPKGMMINGRAKIEWGFVVKS